MATVVSKGEERQQRVNLPKAQNVVLIWVDRNMDVHSPDFKNTITHLRRAVNDISTYTDSDQCIQFVQSSKDSKVCLIISGALAQQMVPRVHGLSQVDSIFILDSNKTGHEQWGRDWPKVKGVYSESTLLTEALRQAAQRCEHNAMPMSFVAGDKKTDQLDPAFRYTQLLREILSTIVFDEEHLKEYVSYCRKAFAHNKEELENIKQLERQYADKTPIWWYTRECFIYPMLNRALRVMDGEVITRMAFFIDDLHQHIEHLHKKQYAGHSATATFLVYRGQGLSKADFDRLQQTKNGFMSFNSFVSTTKERSSSVGVVERAARNPDLVGVLFVMKIDPTQPTTPFASIGKVSAIENDDKVLFAMHSVFRIHDIKSLPENNRFHEVHLMLTSDNDKELRALTERIRKESFPDTEGWYRWGLVLQDMGQLEKAAEIYETLLGRETSDTAKAPIYNQLGLIQDNQGEYQKAISFYEKVLAIWQQSLPPHHPNLAATYNNIGNVYQRIGDYPKALSSYKKALAIRQRSLPRTHPSLASSYNNIGSVYDSMGDYPKALSSHEKALAIRQKSLPPNHPNLAASCNNIGNVYHRMDDYAKALSSHEKALAMRQTALPPTHPHVAMSYNNIGSVYYSMADYTKALSYYEKALAIRQESLSPTHPDVAATYDNIGAVHEKNGNHAKACSFYGRAVQSVQQSLPANHPNLQK